MISTRREFLFYWNEAKLVVNYNQKEYVLFWFCFSQTRSSLKFIKIHLWFIYYYETMKQSISLYASMFIFWNYLFVVKKDFVVNYENDEILINYWQYLNSVIHHSYHAVVCCFLHIFSWHFFLNKKHEEKNKFSSLDDFHSFRAIEEMLT